MRVLIAEDDPRMADYLRKGLEKESFAVDVVNNGNDVVKMASANEYDVLLLDILMPGIDGLEACRQVRELGVETPVIMLTARSTVDDKVLGLDNGADDYLPKPFSFVELMARMRAVIRRKKSYAPSLLEIGDLTLDSNRRMVSREGKMIDLSPKEYRLLEYLMRNQGKVVSRFDIIENVWGEGQRMFSNAVDVHMTHLRSKINDGFEKELISTVRGKGYILE